MGVRGEVGVIERVFLRVLSDGGRIIIVVVLRYRGVDRVGRLKRRKSRFGTGRKGDSVVCFFIVLRVAVEYFPFLRYRRALRFVDPVSPRTISERIPPDHRRFRAESRRWRVEYWRGGIAVRGGFGAGEQRCEGEPSKDWVGWREGSDPWCDGRDGE